MKKRLFIGLLVGLLSFLLAVPALAAYYITISITESSGTSYDMLACNVTVDVDYLADNGFISANGTDVRVKNSAGSELPFMLAEDRLLFTYGIAASKTTGLELTTGNTPLSRFAIVTGHGGYTTTTDNANLELGNNFSIEFEGYIDINVGTFPTVESSTESTETSKVTSHNVSLPSGIQSGDLLIVLFNCDDPDARSPIITWPAGWSQLDKLEGIKDAIGAIYKIADGTENSMVTVTTSYSGYSVHQAFRISGYQGVPEITASEATGSSTHPNSPSLDPSWDLPNGTLWVSFFANTANVGTAISSYPANYDDEQQETTVANYAILGSAQRNYIATSEDPGQFTISPTANWVAWTIGVGGYPAEVCKQDAFVVYRDDGDIYSSILGASPKIVSATISSGEYIIKVYANTTNFKLDVDGVNEDSVALGGVSMPDNANGWLLSMPYFNYYTHTTNDTLRITYELDDIIEGTTLPNEESPGTYDGTITWGNNPEGVSITLSGLEVEEEYYYTGGETDGFEDIFKPEPAQLISGVDLEKLSHNPFAPLVNGIAEASGGLLPASILWIGGAWFVLIAIGTALIILVREHLVFAAAVSMGLAIMFYVMGIFDYWVLIVLSILLGASIVHERMPTW